MEDAVALAKIYIKMKNEKAANEALDKVKQIFPAEDKSFLGSFLNVFKADLHLERNDFKKVEQTILEIERMIQELGFQNLIGEKERVLSEFYEKKGDWRNALKHYYLSVDTPPG